MAKNFKHRPLFAQNLPKEVRKPKTEWKILPILWSALKKTAMVLGFFLLIQICVMLFIIFPANKAGGDKVSLPKEMVLYLDFDGSLNEINVAKGFANAFEETPLTLRQTIDAIHKAAADERVKGILARMTASDINLTQAHELNQALDVFKASGKFAYVYSSSYGESARGLGSYALISNFDQIWMQPLGVVTITGLNAEMPFLRKTLDKIGVTPNFYQRKDYKTAYENLTNAEMSPENRETISRLIGDLRDDILNTIPEQVGMDKAQFNALVNKGLFTAEEAKIAGLITHADYVDVLIGDIKEALHGDRESEEEVFVPFRGYVADVKKQKSILKKAPKIGILEKNGT